MRLMLVFGLIIGALGFNRTAYNRTNKGHKVTDIVWFDMTIGGEYVGRIEIGLFGRLVPLTVENFIKMTTSPKTGENYKGSKMYFVAKNVAMKGADFNYNNGSGGVTLEEGPLFKKEILKIKHYGAGWVSMFHPDEEPNASLFIIATGRLSKHQFIVFSKVIKGMHVVRKIDGVEVDEDYVPIIDVVIANCGAEVADPPFYVAKAPATD